MFGIKRREFVTLLGGAAAGACVWPLSLRAQQAQKSYRVDYLALAGDEDAGIVKQRLAELGYAEGNNLIFDFRSAEGHLERLPQIAVDFVKTNPDVIVAGFGTATAEAAQTATASIPIVFTSVGDPIGSGIVKSLNRPGGNITGLHAQAAEIAGKRLQILEELSPGIRIVAALLEPDAPFTSVALPELKSAADARRQRLEICQVRTADRLAISVEAAAQAGATGRECRNSAPARASPANRRSRGETAALRGLQQPGICRGRWIAVVWSGSSAAVPARGRNRRQNIERRKAGGYSS